MKMTWSSVFGRRLFHRLRAVFIACFSALLPACPHAAEASPFQPPDDSLWPQGRYVYQRNCLICHGPYGDGRGEMGKQIKPPPRNFSRNPFKYKSTPPGKLPTDADLERTIREGLPGTAMPVFGSLSDRDVKAVIEYVKSFSSRWRHSTNYAVELAMPKLPAWFNDAEAVRKRGEEGKILFTTSCVACHGPDGSGNGSTSGELTDSWGQPSIPPDLRQEQLRSGRSLETIYRVLMTGIEGSPMPSFDTLSADQRWDLVAYIQTLRRDFSRAKTP